LLAGIGNTRVIHAGKAIGPLLCNDRLDECWLSGQLCEAARALLLAGPKRSVEMLSKVKISLHGQVGFMGLQIRSSTSRMAGARKEAGVGEGDGIHGQEFWLLKMSARGMPRIVFAEVR
jgi:hypothetical protein